MELKNKTKIAVALIELLISLVITAILMMMLFGIVSKKARNSINSGAGIFYCWKDWNGNLYQKLSSDSIQTVSDCKVKIPKDAKNIQVFVVGGGSGGNKFNTAEINSNLNSDLNYTETISDQECIFPNVNENIYTKLIGNSNAEYSVMTTCSPKEKNTNECKRNIKITEDDYNATIVPGLFYSDSTVSENLDDYNTTMVNTQYGFTKDLFKKLIDEGYCYIPVFISNNLEYIQSDKSMTDDSLYYYKGSAGVASCKGSSDGKNYESNKCYKDGILKSLSKTYTVANEYPSDINKFKYKLLKSPINNLTTFKQSSPGNVKRGYAEAGKEYTISSNNVGNGGNPGASGGTTKFGNLRAKGGELRRINFTTVPYSSFSIKSINGLKTAGYFSICSASTRADCYGSMSSQLLRMAENTQIKVNEVTLLPAEYKDNKWLEDNSPQNSTNDIEKTGFGLFGASGPAADCAVKYYPVKEFEYNGLEVKNSEEAKVDSCSTLGHGMGGAIIIKWD